MNSLQIRALARNLFRGRIEEFIPYLDEVFEYAGIENETEIAMFFAQVGIECGGFTRFSENLYYSASQLIDIWPNRFRLARISDKPGLEVFEDKKRNADLFAKQPQKIANYVYGGRMGNRGESSGDGYRFRGRGPKQITGAKNYLDFRDQCDFLKIDFIKTPDALLIPRIGLYGAGWFWKVNKIKPYAELGNVTAVTKIIQGGNLLLKERSVLFNKAMKLA